MIIPPLTEYFVECWDRLKDVNDAEILNVLKVPVTQAYIQLQLLSVTYNIRLTNLDIFSSNLHHQLHLCWHQHK